MDIHHNIKFRELGDKYLAELPGTPLTAVGLTKFHAEVELYRKIMVDYVALIEENKRLKQSIATPKVGDDTPKRGG
jgi:hypothetical protein